MEIHVPFKISLGASIGGAVLVILACFMPFLKMDVSLFGLFTDVPQDSYSVNLINIASCGVFVVLFMVFLIVLSVLKRQKASIAPLVSSVILFCYPFIEFYRNFKENDDKTTGLEKNIAKEMLENMFDLGVGFYVMIIGFIIIGIGIFLSHKDNWDKTTRTMEYIVDGVMVVIIVGVLWLGSDSSNSDSAENFADHPESYCCEISSSYDINENL